MQIISTVNCLKILGLHEINQYIVYNEVLQMKSELAIMYSSIL